MFTIWNGPLAMVTIRLSSDQVNVNGRVSTLVTKVTMVVDLHDQAWSPAQLFALVSQTLSYWVQLMICSVIVFNL